MDIARSRIAQRWLENFSQERDSNRSFSDRALAEKLLQELQFVPTDSVRSHLGEVLIKMLNSGEIKPKIFYSNVISLNEIPQVSDHERAEEIQKKKNEREQLYKEWKKDNGHLLSERVKIKDVDPFSIDAQIKYLQSKYEIHPAAPSYFQHSAFETYYPNQPALHAFGDPIVVAPGSEAITANLLGKLASERTKDFLAAPLSGREVVDQVSTILLVADFAGTGVQIVQYAKTFNANVTIRNRRSRGEIQIVLLCYAVTPLAKEWITLNKELFDRIKFIQGVQTLSTLQWSNLEKEELRSFLTRYVINKRGRQVAFGYEKSGALFCSGFSIPNNLPVVLRQAQGPVSNWHPLFTYENLLQGLTHSTEFSLPPTALIRNHPEFEPGPSLSAATRSPYYPEVLKFLDVLFLLFLNESQARFPPSVNEISGKLRVSMEEIERRLESLTLGGYVDDNLQLTREGKEELKYAQKIHYKKKYSLRTPSKVYYPSSLRLGENW